MKKLIIASLITFLGLTMTKAQVKNSGAVITVSSGSSMVLNDIDYINQTSGSNHGDIDLSGSLYISGDWINNASGGQLLDSTASAGAVIFNGSSKQNINGRTTHFYNLTVNSGADVDVSAGELVKVYNDFTNNGDFTLKANSSKVASLIDAGSASKLLGSGNYKMERYVPSAGWHYVSSPLVKSTSSTNAFWGAAVYSYTENTHSWQPHYANEELDVMKGYDIYYKTVSPTITFSGTYNTDEQSIALTKVYDGYNFVGNPYPCTIDWDASSGWTKTNVYDGIYIWDATLLGGIGDYMEYVGGVGNNGGSRYIPPTQAFFVFVPNGYTSGSLGMTNAVKVNKTSTPFRSNKDAEFFRIKIIEGNLTNSTVIRIHPEAKNGFDGNYDAYKIFHSNKIVPQLYTVNDQVNYSINTIGNIVESTVIPLNYKVGRSGKHCLVFDLTNFDATLLMYDVFLEDKLTGQIVDFKQDEEYIFEADVTDAADRFLIHIVEIGSVQSSDLINSSTSLLEDEDASFRIYAIRDEIKIRASSAISGQLTIVDVSGKQLYDCSLNEVVLWSHKMNTAGVFFVTLIQHGEKFVEKVVVE
jgi:hypothetical protein